MLHRRGFIGGAIGAGLLISSSGGVRAQTRAGPGEASDLLRQVVGSGGAKAGMIAVTLDAQGSATTMLGSSGRDGVALNGKTVFEIGSITKVMTALLLTEMASQGELSLDDPVAKHLPGPLVPRVKDTPITLLDLATYTSGLPNMPDNMPPRWWELPNPYADYSDEKLAEFLGRHEPEYAPGSQYRYANLGFGLLGMALAHRAGMSYERLLVERICDPLGMGHTRITLTAEMAEKVAQGHDRSLNPAIMWDMSVLQGGGALRSTAMDLTRFLSASMGLRETPLQGAMSRLFATRRPTVLPGTDAALGWFLSADGEEEVAWKSGLTAGFSSFVGFSTRTHRGAVVLSNGFFTPAVGFRLINPDFRPQGNLELLTR